MTKSKLKHVTRRLTDEERARHAQIRAAALKDIPPKAGARRKPSPPGIPARIRAARESRDLTWYALAKIAEVDQGTIRDIEQGKDAKLADVQTVAAALGLKLELVEQVA